MGDVSQGVRKKKLVKKTGFPRHVKDMSKEQLEATIKKKRECNAKALIIVEQMLEAHVNEHWFLDQLRFIDVGHFQDITEERALSKLCGYPLCTETLKSFPSQQFRISTKYNKVYDITERKNFCSNLCYKASKFVKDQLLTSPLWLRDKEEIPKFTLLPLGSLGTGAGEEVDFGQNDTLKSEVTKFNEKFISVAEYTQNSISRLSKKIGDDDDDDEVKEKTKEVNKDMNAKENCSRKIQSDTKSLGQEQCSSVVQKSEVIEEENEKTYLNHDKNLHKKLEKQEEKQTHERCNGSGDSSSSNHQINSVISDNNIELNNENHKIKENSLKNKHNENKTVKPHECLEVTSSVIHIEKCLHEWFTIDTMCFLFGDEKVKDLVSDKGECIKEYYRAVGKSSWDPVIQERYEALCRRLNIMEIQEKQNDKEEQALKPLPDYNVLKEDGLKMDIKIQAFYQGKTNYDLPINTDKEGNEVYTPSCVLPLIDIHAQNALRRRMVLDNLKRVLPDLLCTFGLSSRDISSEVRYLVGSFSLSAHNITFSPAEWNLLGLIIIKMLSIKDMRLKIVLETQQGIKYQTMLLMAFQQDGGYLERLMVWLTDMDNIMKKT